ncbi:MAG TPA: threonine/homoserine exporter RhtA [Steroidobacteraceae bacterium]|nr:threonine/homoserine exporter RhtA [Steroidobacteraceae bacterium]
MPALLVPVLALLLGMVSVQSGASIAKTMFPLAGPLGTVALRVGFGTVILCAVLRPWRVRIPAPSRVPILVYGIALGIMNMCFYQALSRLPLGVAVALEFTGPLAVAILFSRRAIDFLWVLLAIAGLSLLLPVLQVRHGIDPVGALYALGAGACWAVYIVSGQKAGLAHGAQSVALGSLISAVLVLPVGILSAPPTFFSASVLLPGIAVAILSTALPYLLDMVALTRLPTRTFGVLMSIEPAIGALTGLLVLDEKLSASQWIAIALIILASIGVTASGEQTMSAPIPD